MTKAKLTHEILKLMELSGMEDKERSLWTLLLPSMDQKQLEKLHKNLDKEVNELTKIYINALQGKKITTKASKAKK